MLERRNIHAAGLVQRVNAIVQGNVTHMTLREINLGVLPAHDVVTSKAGEVFGYDQVDASMSAIIRWKPGRSKAEVRETLI